MLKIEVLLKDNYIISYSDYGFQGMENGEFHNISEEYFDKYETLKNGGVVETKYYVNDFFKSNYRFFKLENDVLIYDETKKIEFENEIKKQEKENIQNQIMQLTQQKEFYEFKGWDTSTIDSQIAELENRLLTY